MKFLRIHLEGTQQYFSAPYDTALKSVYPTVDHPTINVIVGMIGCAMGLSHGHRDIDNMKEKLVFKYINTKHNRPLVKADFRVTSLGKGETFTKMDGSADDRGQIKNIEFIYDAAYDVYIGADEDTLVHIHNALAHPYWPVYLGRTQCVPSKPLVGPNPEIISEEDLPNVHDCP